MLQCIKFFQDCKHILNSATTKIKKKKKDHCLKNIAKTTNFIKVFLKKNLDSLIDQASGCGDPSLPF